MGREGQKQLNVRIPEELKAKLEQVRDEQGTTFTAIVSAALREYFEHLESQELRGWTGDNAQQLARLEEEVGEQLGRVLELLGETADDQADNPEPDETKRRTTIRRRKIKR